MKTNLKCKLIGGMLMLCFALTACSAGASRDYSDWDYEQEETSDDSDQGVETERYVSDAGDMLSGIVTGAVSGIVTDAVSGFKENYLEDSMENLIEDLTEDALEEQDHLKDFKGRWGQQRKSSKDQLTIKDVNAESFQIDIDMGNINVSYGKNDAAIVNVKYTASGNKKDVVKKILQTVDIDYSIKKDTLQIFFVNKNTKENIWDWISEKYNSYNLGVDLDIILPETMNKFDIDNSLGYIGLNSVKGTFDINNTLGDIDLKDTTFIGKSKIKAGLGKIECSLSNDIQERSEVTLDNSLGDIRIDTNSLFYKKGKQEKSYGYWNGSDSKTVLIKGLCKMNLYVDMGEISIK